MREWTAHRDVSGLMDPRPPDRFEDLLTRAFDGEITPAERAELDALADVEPRLAALAELRVALRAALAVPGPVDVAGEVMAALAADERWSLGPTLREAFAEPVDLADAVMAGLDDAAWLPVGAALREAVAAPVDLADAVMAGLDESAWLPVGAALREAVAVPVDVADAVLAALDPELELSAFADGELAPERMAAVEARLAEDADARARVEAFAATGDALRGATTRTADLWAGIADGIGAERDAVHGWDEIAAPLRAAFADLPPVDVADAVLAAVAPAERTAAPAERTVARRTASEDTPGMPRWASLGGPLLAFAIAAAMLFAILPPTPRPGGDASVRLAEVNDAQIEEVSAPADVVVQVMQFEEGGPTFILVDDPSGSGVPL